MLSLQVPPTSEELFSYSVKVLMPRFCNSIARVMPERPAPTMTIRRGFLDGMVQLVWKRERKERQLRRRFGAAGVQRGRGCRWPS